MKTKVRFFSILAAVITVGLITFHSCQKSDVEQAQPQEQFNDYKLGALLLTEEEYAKIPLAPDLEATDLKAAVSLSCPPIRNQGAEGSCVAWGTAYAGRSIEWKRTHPASSYSTSVNIFSPEYVYNQIKISSSCGSGSYVTSGLNLLKSQGVCRWSVMPYTDYSCSTYPNSTQKADAANYKISGYSAISRTASNFKAYLNAGRVIIVAGSVDQNYMNLGYNQILYSRGSSLGGHCYAVVGYDDAKGAFKIMNSWGTSWGTSGFGWISYNYMTQWFSEAYYIY